METTPTTITMTQPKIQSPWTDEQWHAHYNHPDCVAMREFANNNSQYNKVPSKFYAELDMTQAHVGLTQDFIDRHATVTTTSEDGTTQDVTYTIHRQWAVFAPRLTDGVLFTAVANTVSFFNTEAEATKFMKKITKLAFEWQFLASLRKQYTAQAQAVCANHPDTASPAGLIDENECIGEHVQIRQMGKRRVGIIAGQTPTKYIVVYTTPSNRTEIRTTTVKKGA